MKIVALIIIACLTLQSSAQRKEGKIIGRFNEEEAPLDKLLLEIFGK